MCGSPFGTVLHDRITTPLQLKSTGLLESESQLFGDGLSNTSLEGEPASLGLTSSIADLSKLGHATLASDLLDKVETRRWLKPVTSTSNLRNAGGRPWEIYHFVEEAVSPIVDAYLKSGSLGRYSSYFDLVPSVDVGFAILAVDIITEAPDLNAYADIVLQAVVQVQRLGYQQASQTLAGTYHASANESLQLALTGYDPGTVVTSLPSKNTDWLEVIAERIAAVETESLDLRLYPTGLEGHISEGGKRQVFQGVIQDKGACRHPNVHLVADSR